MTCKKNEPWFDVDFGVAIGIAENPLDSIMFLRYHYDAGCGDEQKVCLSGIVPFTLAEAVAWNLFYEYGDLLI